MKRKSPNVLYLGDVLDRLPWDPLTGRAGGPWRIVEIHGNYFMRVERA